MRIYALALVLSGCASEMALAARDAYAARWRCDRARLAVEPLTAGAYRVTGCVGPRVVVCEAATGLASLDDPAVCRMEDGR